MVVCNWKTLDTVCLEHVIRTLKRFNGNRTHSAKALGISIRKLRNMIREATELGYDVPPAQTGINLW